MATPTPTQTAEVEKAQAQVNKVLEDSGRYFREGLTALKANHHAESGAKFDKSVEIFLYSALNIQKDHKLQTCFSQLIETIYLIEFPSEAKPPQLHVLSASRRWRWNSADLKLADDVALMIKPTAKRNDTAVLASALAGKSVGANIETTVGFNSQEFEPSPLDELSKLELTLEETELSDNNPLYTPRSTRNVSARTVTAQAGDTVAKLARRYDYDPVEVAKYNGLLPNSNLGAGRQIRLPATGEKGAPGYVPYARPSPGRAESASSLDCAVETMPLVQGLRLGISPAQVYSVSKRRFTWVKARTYYSGQAALAAGKSNGVRFILLKFYDSRLYEITVYYDDSIRWAGVREFERAVARALKIPNSWMDGSSCTVGRNCRLFLCAQKKFHLSLGESGGLYSLNIWDPVTYSQMLKDDNNRRLAERTRKELEQRRKKNEFKP